MRFYTGGATDIQTLGTNGQHKCTILCLHILQAWLRALHREWFGPTAQLTQGTGQSVPVPSTVQSTMYTPGFLTTQIGKLMRVEFLIGTNGPLIDRVGTLIAVGASYILLRPTGSDDLLLCDIYSIKFVTILL
jgi:hypothetical protein